MYLLYHNRGSLSSPFFDFFWNFFKVADEELSLDYIHIIPYFELFVKGFFKFFWKKLVANRIGTVSRSNGWGLHRCLFRKSHPPLTSIIIHYPKANFNRQTAQIWDFFRIKVCAVCLLKNSVGYGIMEISPVACDNGRFEKKNLIGLPLSDFALVDFTHKPFGWDNCFIVGYAFGKATTD